MFLVREKTKPLFFVLQLYSWDVVLLSNHSLNYTGIFSRFALSKSKSHLNPSKYCTIASPAVVFCSNSQFQYCTKEKCYKCTDFLVGSTDTIYEMLRSLRYSIISSPGLKWLVLWDPEYQKKFLSFASLNSVGFFDRLQYFRVCRLLWAGFFSDLVCYLFIWLSKNPAQHWKYFPTVNITKHLKNV